MLVQEEAAQLNQVRGITGNCEGTNNVFCSSLIQFKCERGGGEKDWERVRKKEREKDLVKTITIFPVWREI